MKWIRKFVVMMTSILLLTSVIQAKEPQGLYTNGQWDAACNRCWPAPHLAQNNHCSAKECAIQGYYHCKPQDPPLAVDDDPRIIDLIHSGVCARVSSLSLNDGEAAYVNSMRVCTQVLDKMAGRFISPPHSHDATKMKVDFLLTRFKAEVLGNAQAKLKLAMNYDSGIGIPQNRSKATELYQQAAMKGVPFAQYAIAARYAYGISMPKDTDQALIWLKKALGNQPKTDADKKAHEVVAPCAIKLIERLTPI